MIKRVLVSLVIFFVIFGVAIFFASRSLPAQTRTIKRAAQIIQTVATNPLKITDMRRKQYPGSKLIIEQTLPAASNYNQYIASYMSDGNELYGLLTIPITATPSAGFPVIIFNHGYVPPDQYSTTQSYASFVDALAQSGYIVFKPDYRGHGNSGGTALGEYGMASYAVDVLNALASLKTYPGVNPNKIGMFGHSMGGEITLRSMVVSKDIKSGVIWAGVVGSYPDMYAKIQDISQIASSSAFTQWKDVIFALYGKPDKNSVFWNEISPINYINDISGPLQIQTATSDVQVPASFSESLHAAMQKAGKTDEFYEYPNDDHLLSHNFTLAMQRSVAFFDKYLK